MSTSEIARIREQIELECQAIRNLMQFTAVASHRTINGRYRNLEQYHQQLKELVSEEEAVDILVGIYNEWVK
jgi:hypothetical protein